MVVTATLLLLVFVLGLLLSATGRGEPALQVLHVGPHTAGENMSMCHRFIKLVVRAWQPGFVQQREQDLSSPSHPHQLWDLPSLLPNQLSFQDPSPLSNTDVKSACN